MTLYVQAGYGWQFYQTRFFLLGILGKLVQVDAVGWYRVVLGVVEIFFILGWKIAYRWRYRG